MRKAFTLIELLVIIAIVGIMVTVGTVSVTGGKGAVRVKGATRDVFAAIRHARSTALVTGQPAIITYSNTEEDGEPVAKIEISSAKLFDSSVDRSKVQTLTGEPLRDGGHELVHIRREGEEPRASHSKRSKGQELVHVRGKSSDKLQTASADAAEEAEAESDGSGDSIEDILFSPIDVDIVKGMRLKVVHGDELLESGETARPNRISVFSNVDYLLGKFKDAKAAEKKKEEEKGASGGKSGRTASKEPQDEPVSIVWETNGRVEPHQVWIYADGQKPEDGLSIKIDRFGAAKVISGDGKDDE